MGPAWRNGGMSMRNPMSRQPMNNNPMGNQAPMQPNFGRAIGAIGSTSLPYAGGGLGMAGPAGAAQGMSAMRPAPVRQQPQGNFYSRAMAGDPIYGQNGIGSQRAAQNVLMGQPAQADTRMRGLNIPGMQFDPNQNAMVRQQRPQLTQNPNPERWGNLSAPSSSGSMIDPSTQRMNTRIARAGRLAGVRPGDMAQWRQQSPTAIAMRNGAANAQMAAGPRGGTPAQMGTGGQMAGPPAPAAQPMSVAQAAQAEVPPRIQAIQQETDRQFRPVMNMPDGAAPLVTTKPLSTASQNVVGNDEYYGNNAVERWWMRNVYGRQQPQSYQPQQWRSR